MTGYQSHSTLQQHRLKNLFLPPLIVWLLYGLVSLIMLTLMNITALWELLLGQPVTSQDITPLTEKFSNFQDHLSTPVVMLFWLCIGAITYIIIWLLENVVFIARTEVAESQYRYANTSQQKKHVRSTIRSNGILALTALIWVCFIALYLRVLLPAYSQLFHTALFSAPVYKRFMDLIVAVVGNTLAIYVFLLMGRILSYSWRLNRSA